MANSRAALVEAALEEFTARGYEAATVAGIAERAGVTTGAVYAHFASKLDLLLASVDLTPVADLERLIDERRPAATPAMLARGLASRPDQRRVLLLDVIVAARRDPAVAEVLRAGLEAYVRASARATGADAASRLLAVLNLGMIVFSALDARTPPVAAFERLVEVLLPMAAEADTAGGADSSSLTRVEAGAAAGARAEDVLHERIVAAIEEGHSLRQVGAAAGLSHEAVRRIAAGAGAGAGTGAGTGTGASR
jgi:AcrR family transcriptional regulator